ncbi:MAG: bifunctional GNAT family N-acetyltransferase/NUDIX hydrolase [Myxococcota bacterium]
MTSPTMRSPIAVRRAMEADAEALSAIDARVVADQRGVVRAPGEFTGVEPTRDQIRRFAAPDVAMFVAEVDGAVAGQSTVQRLGASYTRHVGLVAVQVDPLHQGRGVGRALVEAANAFADGAGIERLQLYVVGDNDRAIGLYRSVGFALESVRTRFLLRPEGWCDDLTMVRWCAPVEATKVAAVLVRSDGGIALFHHPVAGIQLPKGTLEPGEDPLRGALRELDEESGVAVGAARPLGGWIQPAGSALHRWIGFVADAPVPLEGPDAPEGWDHPARGSPDEQGLVFRYRWYPPALALAVLPAAYHELVHRAVADRRRRSSGGLVAAADTGYAPPP